MTRKRFIKLAMAKGYSRNSAAALARMVRGYGSYAAMYAALFSLSDAISEVKRILYGFCDGLSTAFKRLADSFGGGVL